MSGRREGEVARVVGGRHHSKDEAPSSALLARAGKPLGNEQRVIRIGSTRVQLKGLDERCAGLVDRNYAGFIEGQDGRSAGDSTLRPVEVCVAAQEYFLYLPRAEGLCEEARMDARSTDPGLELWSYFFAGSFDRDATSGKLFLCEGGEIDTTTAIENYLRFFVSTAALSQGGFLLHSSGVLRGTSSYLFFGPSGAGKSTASVNVPGDAECLGDDLVLIEQTHKGYDACGVPFRGSFAGDERNSTGRGELQIACRLFQSTENRLEETSRIIQVAELLGELPFLLDDTELQERATQATARFVKHVQVSRLHLRNDPSYWDVLPPPR